MDRQLRQLRDLQYHLGVPVVIAGDVFDDGWRPHRCPPELINFALRFLPDAFAIPGQHDLPHHRYEDKHKSAYWTLVRAGKLINLAPGSHHRVDDHLILHGFPWSYPPEPLPPTERSNDLEVHLLVAHAYIWISGHSYPGAPEEQRAKNYWEAIRTYDAAVFGDNHKGWMKEMAPENDITQRISVMNCGTFYRRKSAEREYKPVVGILTKAGCIIPHYLDVSQDVIANTAQVNEQLAAKLADFQALVQELTGDNNSPLDFLEAVKLCLRNPEVDDNTKQLVLKLIGG